MKICLVAPGIMPIPPDTWGAVEMMLWDYYNILIKNNIDVDIINNPCRFEIIEKINSTNYDVVHIHYDLFVDIINSINSKVKIISSHYPFINNPNNYINDGYDKIINQITNNKDFHIFASSQKDIDTFIGFGAKKENTFLSKLGIRYEPYTFYKKPEYDKTLCFSQIVDRKRQYIIQDIESIDFMGRMSDLKFSNHKNYKGEVSREFLNQEISKYSNFILISSIENTTPLAPKEALMCGLGLVVSEAVAYELDTNLDFIDVIPENKINNIDFIKEIINKNKETSIKKRSEIRQYAIDTFGLENILINSYIKKIENLLK